MISFYVQTVLIVRAREGVEHSLMFGPNWSLTTVNISCEAGLIWPGNFTHGGGLSEIVEHSNSSTEKFAVNRLQVFIEFLPSEVFPSTGIYTI